MPSDVDCANAFPGSWGPLPEAVSSAPPLLDSSRPTTVALSMTTATSASLLAEQCPCPDGLLHCRLHEIKTPSTIYEPTVNNVSSGIKSALSAWETNLEIDAELYDNPEMNWTEYLREVTDVWNLDAQRRAGGPLFDSPYIAESSRNAPGQHSATLNLVASLDSPSTTGLSYVRMQLIRVHDDCQRDPQRIIQSAYRVFTYGGKAGWATFISECIFELLCKLADKRFMDGWSHDEISLLLLEEKVAEDVSRVLTERMHPQLASPATTLN